MARGAGKFHVPSYDRDAVDTVIRALQKDAVITQFTKKKASTMDFIILTAVNRMRLRGWDELSYYTEEQREKHFKMYKRELDATQPYKQTHYRFIRFFFTTPKGYTPQIPPLEVLSRRQYNWTTMRSSVYPYHDQGWGWKATYQTEEFWHPDRQHGGDSHVGEWALAAPSVEIIVNGKTVRIMGKRLDGTYAFETACNEKCTSAVGPQCSCSCGGANHGTGAVIARWKPRANSEQRKILEGVSALLVGD